MGHGNSNKLYVTHAEHSGLFGQHTASSSGFKACVALLIRLVLYLLYTRVASASQRVLTLLPLHRLTVVPCLSSHSLIRSAPAMRTEQGLSSILPTLFLG